jgi:hypothetical protein
MDKGCVLFEGIEKRRKGEKEKGSGLFSFSLM